MFRSLLSVLLVGLIPAWGAGGGATAGLHGLSVAPPSSLHPVMSMQQALPIRRLSASGMIILDVQSGEKIAALNARARRPIGSLTKLMTALIIAEQHDLAEEVQIPGNLGTMEGTVAHLPPGHHFTVGDLVSAMLIASANDAAETLARYHSGSSEAFVRVMNARAAILGLNDTSYVNPAGLDAAGGWSTPQDIAWLTLFVLRREELRSRMSQASATIRSREGKVLALTHTHEMMRNDPRIVAGKTGTTDAARQCLMSVVREGRSDYIVVLLDSLQRYDDMRIILRNLRSST